MIVTVAAFTAFPWKRVTAASQRGLSPRPPRPSRRGHRVTATAPSSRMRLLAAPRQPPRAHAPSPSAAGAAHRNSERALAHPLPRVLASSGVASSAARRWPPTRPRRSGPAPEPRSAEGRPLATAVWRPPSCRPPSPWPSREWAEKAGQTSRSPHRPSSRPWVCSGGASSQDQHLVYLASQPARHPAAAPARDRQQPGPCWSHNLPSVLVYEPGR
mmetsp:Transcript_65097/g.146302  ORF Transcript_65097/g.146302 Transcript_65097/m.146302 type:complete len:215 (+) Transcript_65097:188-832(+)